MAKKSKVVKNERRRAIVARYAQRRAELKEIIRSPSSTAEQREAAQRELVRQHLPHASRFTARRTIYTADFWHEGAVAEAKQKIDCVLAQ